MRSRLVVLAALAAIAVLSACVLAPVIQAQVAPTSTRTSDIRATVLSVEKLQFPRARLRLRITGSSNPSVLSVGGRIQEVVAQNYLRTTGGKVDFQSKDNIGSIAAYYLLQGDEIRGKLFSGSSTPGRTGDWFIYGIERGSGGGSTDGSMTSTNQQGNMLLTLGAAIHGTGQPPVQLSLTVENTGAQTEVFRFSSGQQFDFIVSSGGREVWRWSAGRMFIQSLTSFALAPGEKKTFTATWPRTDNQGRKVEPGVYAVQGIVTSTSPSTLSVGPVTVTLKSRE